MKLFLVFREKRKEKKGIVKMIIKQNARKREVNEILKKPRKREEKKNKNTKINYSKISNEHYGSFISHKHTGPRDCP